MGYLILPPPSIVEEDSDVIVDGKRYLTSLDSSSIRRLKLTDKYNDHDTVSLNDIDSIEHVDRALNRASSVCYLYDVMDSQYTPYMIHDIKDKDNSVRTTYDDIQGYHDKLIVCGQTVILFPSMVYVFGAELRDYMDPNYTDKYKELCGYVYTGDGKKIIRCAVLPENIAEFTPSMVSLHKPTTLKGITFHSLQHDTEMIASEGKIDGSVWMQMEDAFEDANLGCPIMTHCGKNMVPTIEKCGEEVHIRLYDISSWVNLKDKESNTFDVFSYRAECQGDVIALHNSLMAKGKCGRITKFEPDLELGEVLVEVQLWGNTTVEDVENVLREQDDAHVMLQTLRPMTLELNSMVRDTEKE